MKFFYKTGGKILAFIFCILCAAIALAACAGGCGMLQEDYYSRSEREIYDDMIYDHLISDAEQVLRDANNSGYCPVLLSDRGNLSFMAVEEGGKHIAISRGAQNAKLGYDPDNYTYRIDCQMKRFDDGSLLTLIEDDPEQKAGTKDFVNCTVCFNLHSPFTAKDAYARVATLAHIGYSLRWWIFVIGLVFLILGIWFFVVLMRASGRDHDGTLRPGPLDKIPFDVLLALCIIPLGLYCEMMQNGLQDGWAEVIAGCAGLAVLACIGLGMCMSFAGRIKRGTLLKNTLIYRLFQGLRRLVGMLPLVWRTSLIVLGVCLFEFLAIGLSNGETDNLLICWFLEKLILVPAVLYLALGLRKLQAGGEALAKGNLGFQTDTKGLVWALKTHGENLNSIAVGMNRAVEERIRSERMKTELITNVSHDLKTPLTSILNYSGLIAAEPCANEKITEYAGVLTRQSAGCGGAGTGDENTGGAHSHHGRRTADVADLRQSDEQHLQIRHDGNQGLPEPRENGGQRRHHIQKYLPRTPGYLRGGAFGAVCPGR